MRKYALTKIVPGEYLVPTNEGDGLYRVSSYEEDGSAWYERDGKQHTIRGTHWQTYRWTGTLDDFQLAIDAASSEFDLIRDERWEFLSWMHPTRRAALDDLFGEDTPPPDDAPPP